MNQFQSSLKRATSAEEAWQLIDRFLSRISDGSNRHMIRTIDGSGEKTAMYDYDNSREPPKKPDRKRPCTHHMWLFVDPPQTISPVPGNPSQAQPRKDRHGNLLPAIGASLLYAHARITSLKQKEKALKVGITPRERETLSLLARGLRSDKIAHHMGIKRVTVNLHISNSRRKLGSTTREQAVARAVHMGIITP